MLVAPRTNTLSFWLPTPEGESKGELMPSGLCTYFLVWGLDGLCVSSQNMCTSLPRPMTEPGQISELSAVKSNPVLYSSTQSPNL